MTIATRPLEPGDRNRWNALWQGFLAFTDTVLPDEVTETTWRRLLDATEQPSGIVAVDTNNRIVGFAHYLFHRSTWAGEGYCYLEDLFVDPDGRGSGAGRVLILAVETVAREKGCQEMYLTTEDSNATARALYDKVMSKTPFIEYRTVLK